MLSDDRVCCQALKSRDPRFDGRFFVGVSSTRIYCRPWRAYAVLHLWKSLEEL